MKNFGLIRYALELMVEEKFDEAILLLSNLKNPKERIRYCHILLFTYASTLHLLNNGDITIVDDKKIYEREKRLEFKNSPNILLLENEEGYIEGIKNLVANIPDKNPLRIYYINLLENVK